MSLLESAWLALGGEAARLSTVRMQGEGALPSCFRVSEAASASVACAGLALAQWCEQVQGARASEVVVASHLASAWFSSSVKAQGWEVPSLWDAMAGDYAASDGWIRLHTNAPAHRAAARKVLGLGEGPTPDKARTQQAVAPWHKAELEAVVLAAGGCAAQMLSTDEWHAHPQGQAVQAQPLVFSAARQAQMPWAAAKPRGGGIAGESGLGGVGGIDGVQGPRPLAGIRVLDLTRVLAGPTATRFLAGCGADVLRIDPPDWNEPAVLLDMMLGKRSVRMDLRQDGARQTLLALMAQAHVLVHGYRADALEGLGLGESERRRVAPDLVEVQLNAYGWSGPWMNRRGFDSLVQMSSGIAHAGMLWRAAGKPTPLPVQALDHAAGYLLAAAALRGLVERAVHGQVMHSRLSLARTAHWLQQAGPQSETVAFAALARADYEDEVEATGWGPCLRLRPPVQVSGAPLQWPRPAKPLGGDAAAWRV